MKHGVIRTPIEIGFEENCRLVNDTFGGTFFGAENPISSSDCA